MQKNVTLKCPKCNNSHQFYRYGRDPLGFQKYQCRVCSHQFAPDRPTIERTSKHPKCPVCGKATFIHHDFEFYTQYRCGDKKCYHAFMAPKPTIIPNASMSKLFGKTDFKRMRHPAYLILQVLSLFYLGKNSFRGIAFQLRYIYGIKLSHTTINNWCKRFAPMFHNISLELIPLLDFNSDEWHADETVVKIKGRKYYIWFIVDSETRFVLGFHLSPFRNSTQAFTLFNSVTKLGDPGGIVTDRLWSYEQPTRILFPKARHIQVQDFKDAIPNNLIESFNHQFKAWYKTKQGFCSFESANNMISMFVHYFNFIRPHSGLNGMTPAEVAGLNLTEKDKRKYLLTIS